MSGLINTQAEFYNNFVRTSGKLVYISSSSFNIHINCTITGFIDQPYGKFPEDNWN